MLEKQSRLLASGNSGGHAYLLIPNRQRGFARVGFWLDDAEQRIFIPWGDTWKWPQTLPSLQQGATASILSPPSATRWATWSPGTSFPARRRPTISTVRPWNHRPGLIRHSHCLQQESLVAFAQASVVSADLHDVSPVSHFKTARNITACGQFVNGRAEQEFILDKESHL